MRSSPIRTGCFQIAASGSLARCKGRSSVSVKSLRNSSFELAWARRIVQEPDWKDPNGILPKLRNLLQPVSAFGRGPGAPTAARYEKSQRIDLTNLRSSYSLKIQLQRHLNFAGGGACSKSLAEGPVVNVRVRRAEMWVVQSVKRLGSIFEPHPLPDLTQRKFLEDRKVCNIDPGRPQVGQHSGCRSQSKWWRRHSDFRIGEVLVHPLAVAAACLLQRA